MIHFDKQNGKVQMFAASDLKEKTTSLSQTCSNLLFVRQYSLKLNLYKRKKNRFSCTF